MTSFLSTLLGTDSILVGTLVPFLFVLTIVVFVHEMGHYLVGRWCGIGVKAFSIGFGPELIGFNDRRGTRWKISAVPLGGYVKFLGDMSVTSSPDPGEMERLTAEERKTAFHTQPVWKRAATVFAGPAFNFLLTICVFAVFFSIYGQYISDPVVAEVRPDSPAQRAGFLPGDKFIRVDGQEVTTFADVQRMVSGRAGDSITFVMLRSQAEVSLVAVPEIMEQKDALGNTIKLGAIGVVSNEQSGQPRLVSYSPPGALLEAVKQTGHIVARTGQFLKRFVGGREDKCQLGGPIRIADMAGKAAKVGFERVVELIALLSVGIGILNLLPIPPLDGGHLAFYGYEAIFRRPVSERTMEAVYRVGIFAVLGFMAFVVWNDLFGC